MFWFLKRKNDISPDTADGEEWKENFSIFRKSRFKNEKEKNYISEVKPGSGLQLVIKKENIFAWCKPPESIYTDFDAQCSFSFESDFSYCSGGLLFRMGNDYNYYYFLLSNRGYYRVDCVFNGNPMRLIGWTPLSFPHEKTNTLRITAWGSVFLFYINGRQVAKLNDETIGSGFITFCGQNYDRSSVPAVAESRDPADPPPASSEPVLSFPAAAGTAATADSPSTAASLSSDISIKSSGRREAVLLLKKLKVTSVPADVEKAYSEIHEIADEQKLLLARSFFDRGQFLPAAVQVKSYLKNNPSEGKNGELISWFGEILVNLGMYEDALIQFEKCLEKDPQGKNYLLEKGNILYQLGRYDKLKTFLLSSDSVLEAEPLYWNLLGHSFFYLGRNTDAEIYYKKAAEIDPENPLYFLNAAKTLESSKKDEEAASYYAESSVLFFREGNYGEALSAAELALKKVSSGSSIRMKGESVIAKISFQNNDFREAEKKFKEITTDYPDECGSEIFFLYGLIQFEKGKHKKAAQLVEKACEKESSFYLYWYKLAEIYRAASPVSAGPEKSDVKTADALSKAYELAPDDFLVNNLLGTIALENNNIADAEKYFETAFRVKPEYSAGSAAVNYSEALLLNGKTDKALYVLDSVPSDADVLLQKGKIFSESGQSAAALRQFTEARDLYPESLPAAKTLVIYYYNNEEYGKAEEIISSIADAAASDSGILNIRGNIARVRGDFDSAFSDYRKSLELDFDPVVALNYIDGLCETLDFKKASEKYEEYFGADSSETCSGAVAERKEKLFKQIERETVKALECSICGRKWKVPKNIKEDRRITIKGDPDPESPAGQCPSCKKIFCIRCASEWIKNGRFCCPECGENLKLSDRYLRYLASLYASKSASSD
ncbi:MAG: tetratricopeptide repeat protein [Spirochaetia bacterium]|jgi:tetratricopeptide (TPR) repeat protein|nr:tetratricopeptide repeat protein [Spirochaetia bacterium]